MSRRALVLLTLLLGVFLSALDAGIVSPAFSVLNEELFRPAGVPELTSWVITIYVLTAVVSAPLMAKLSNIWGRKPVYILDISLFAVGSAFAGMAEWLGGLSNGWWLLLVGRFIQALGTGGITPVAVAEVGNAFPPEKRGAALGLLGGLFGLASVVGPPLGGVISENFGWAWIFFINMPLCALVIILATRLENHPEEANSRFDWPGALVLTLLLVSFMYGLTQLGKDGGGGRTTDLFASLGSLAVWPFLAIGGALFGPFLWLERRASNPIVPVRILNRRQILVGYLLSMVAGAVMGVLIFLPITAQYLLGSKPSEAGILVVPLALVTVFVTPTAGVLLDKIGSRLVLAIGSLIAALGSSLLGFWASDTLSFIISVSVLGVGFGAIIGSPIRYIIINEVSGRDRAPAISASAIFQQSGLLLGTTIIGAIIGARAVLLDEPGRVNLQNQSDIKTFMQPAIQQAFGIMGFSLVVACLVTLFLLKRRAEEKATLARQQTEDSVAAGSDLITAG